MENNLNPEPINKKINWILKIPNMLLEEEKNQ